MARNGSGVYSLPSGYEATTGQTATAIQHNTPLEDIADDLNAARPVVAGGTGATTASGARTNLGVPATADVQPVNANLTSLAGLTLAADKGLYSTAADTVALFDLTAAGRALLDDADASAQRTTLGLGGLATLDTVGASEIDDGAVTTAKLASGERMTAENVSVAYAARSLDEIGQMRIAGFVYAGPTVGNPYTIGSTYAGSAWSLTGTWRVMGAATASFDYYGSPYTQWVWLLKRTA